MVLVSFWRYPDPHQRFLIRIRIRSNDTDPTGSGSATLIFWVTGWVTEKSKDVTEKSKGVTELSESLNIYLFTSYM